MTCYYRGLSPFGQCQCSLSYVESNKTDLCSLLCVWWQGIESPQNEHIKKVYSYDAGNNGGSDIGELFCCHCSFSLDFSEFKVNNLTQIWISFVKLQNSINENAHEFMRLSLSRVTGIPDCITLYTLNVWAYELLYMYDYAMPPSLCMGCILEFIQGHI